jgi:phosphoribosylformylglycinamidine synthase
LPGLASGDIIGYSMKTEVNLQTALDHGLTAEEFQKTKDILGRDPNIVELGIIAAMWSEHCSYKSSRIHLAKFPTTGKQVIHGPGENAGVVDIGDGTAVVFKMESHNHPSYIEPVEGAATGVGGILRDVFTMGARPVASLDCLRFGDVSHERTPYLVDGVIKGISSYGNCIGVPTVGGSTRFHECYNGNILVNVMNVGLAKTDAIFLGDASGVGNKVIYIGSATGRDGIHGAVMASDTFGEGSEEKRPTVQVGDPFTEKLLLEACLEIFREKLVEGIQDMGAAGLTSSSFEMAERGESGLTIHLDRVPMREEGMTPYELMLSESQERMLLVAKPENERKILDVLKKWDLEASTIGVVEDHGDVKLFFNGELVADIPVKPLVSAAPKLDRPTKRPAYLDKVNAFDTSSVKEPKKLDEVLLKLVSSMNLNSKKWITEQYDTMVGINTVVGPGSDCAIIRVKGEYASNKNSKKAIAVSAGCNERYSYLDPYVGGLITVSETARNIACSGAKPLALTDCLNFGSPENPEIMWQFAESVRGLASACEALSIPVVSGNVSLYNQTGEDAIYPTPMIGIVGLLDDVEKRVPSFFQNGNDVIFLLGETYGEIGGSEYLKTIHGSDEGKPPTLDLEKEKALIELLQELAKEGLLSSAHDISEGGFAVALVESVLGGAKHGCRVDISTELRKDIFLFSESQSRVIVSLGEKNEGEAVEFFEKHGVPFTPVGRVGGTTVKISVNGDVAVRAGTGDLEDAFESSFSKALFG